MAEKLGVNRDNQKKSNRGLALKLIATGQCESRIDLSRSMGLTKTAISHIVNEMIEKELLIETRTKSTQELGRNPMGLAISPAFPRFIGVLVQRGYCEAILCDLQLNVLQKQRITRSFQNEDELMETVYELVDQMMAYGEKIAAIGVCSIGPVKVREGKIAKPLFFNNIENVPIRSLLEQRYGLPVCFDHDNQSAALAEQLYGNAKGYEDILLVGVARGIGCGILVDGERIHSFTGYAPEIGHISVDRHGVKCVCGNTGCLERYASSDVVLKKLRAATGKEELSYEAFMKLTDDPDVDENIRRKVDEVMQEVIEDLVTALTSVLNIVNSQIVILTMDCCFWPDRYIAQIEDMINERKFGNTETRIAVSKPHFLRQTQVIGAAANAVNVVFSGDMLI